MKKPQTCYFHLAVIYMTNAVNVITQAKFFTNLPVIVLSVYLFFGVYLCICVLLIFPVNILLFCTLLSNNFPLEEMPCTQDQILRYALHSLKNQ